MTQNLGQGRVVAGMHGLSFLFCAWGKHTAIQPGFAFGCCDLRTPRAHCRYPPTAAIGGWHRLSATFGLDPFQNATLHGEHVV